MSSTWGKAAVLAAAAILLAGCGASTRSGTGGQSVTTGSGSRTSASTGATTSSAPEQVCRQAFQAATLLDWTGGTAAQFRAYQYGGPTAAFPLAHAFPGVPDAAPGAWCGTKGGPQTTRWWAVIPGHKPTSTITVTGPGEGVKHGYVSTPPYVP